MEFNYEYINNFRKVIYAVIRVENINRCKWLGSVSWSHVRFHLHKLFVLYFWLFIQLTCKIIKPCCIHFVTYNICQSKFDRSYKYHSFSNAMFEQTMFLKDSKLTSKCYYDNCIIVYYFNASFISHPRGSIRYDNRHCTIIAITAFRRLNNSPTFTHNELATFENSTFDT